MTISTIARRSLTVAAAVFAGPLASAPAFAGDLPRTYVIAAEADVFPEGIAVTGDGTIYVTSSGTGAVYRGNFRDPRLNAFLPAGGDGRTAAAGVRVDAYGRLFVAGWSTGTLFVYSPGGHLLAARPAPDPAALLNDLAITGDAVYVTDSATGTLWRAALRGATVGPLTAWVPPARFPAPPQFLNGIVAGRDGRVALVSDQGTEQLLRVDLATRTVTTVATTGATLAGDGLLLEGDRLSAVVNFPNPRGSGYLFAVRQAILGPDLRTAAVVAESPAVSEAQTPTTVARDRGRLLWVNSQLAAPAPAPPYTVTQVGGA
jgi:sugar lactone lactonase YvrE